MNNTVAVCTSISSMLDYLLEDLRIEPDALQAMDVSVTREYSQLDYKERQLKLLCRAIEAL